MTKHNDHETPIVVHKLNTRGELAVTYDAEVAEWLSDGVRLEAVWSRPPLALGYTTFETGDRFVEWYFSDRWYNIFEIHGRDDQLKGWYCNVAAPAAFSEGEIHCRDLLLDLWVGADASVRILDEDEFTADEHLDATTRAAARAGLDELLRLVASRAYPFSILPSGPAYI